MNTVIIGWGDSSKDLLEHVFDDPAWPLQSYCEEMLSDNVKNAIVKY